MSANTNSVKARLEDQYSRDQPDEQTAERVPETLVGCS